MAMVVLVGAEMEVVDDMYTRHSRGVGCLSGDAGALPDFELIY